MDRNSGTSQHLRDDDLDLHLVSHSGEVASLMRRAQVAACLMTVMLLGGCYVPTRQEVCTAIGADSDGCSTDDAIRERLLKIVPVGTAESVLEQRVNGMLASRSPPPQLSAPSSDGTRSLHVPYKVPGLAVCKESLQIRFHITQQMLTDIDVTSGTTCL